MTQLKTQESKAHEDHSTAANVIPATIVTSPSKTRSRSVSPAKIPGWFCVTVLHVFYSQLISDKIFLPNEPTKNCQWHWLNFSMILSGSLDSDWKIWGRLLMTSVLTVWPFKPRQAWIWTFFVQYDLKTCHVDYCKSMHLRQLNHRFKLGLV